MVLLKKERQKKGERELKKLTPCILSQVCSPGQWLLKLAGVLYRQYWKITNTTQCGRAVGGLGFQGKTNGQISQ